MNDHEAARIAAAMNAARPDWPLRQLTTLLKDQRIANRPRRDVFVALAWVASEQNSASPYRVIEAGPWWKAAGIEGSAKVRDVVEPGERCSVCSHRREFCEANYTDHEFDADFRSESGVKPELVAAARAALRTQPPRMTTTTDTEETTR